MRLSDVQRWLYRGKHPNRLAQLINGATASIGALVAPDLISTLEVRGRKSGRNISLPVVPVTVDGQRYLVSMLGDDVAWVKNVRAADGRAMLRGRRRNRIRLLEVPDNERAPIIKAYLQRAPGARPHVPVDKDAPLEAFQSVAADIPVFRISPTA